MGNRHTIHTVHFEGSSDLVLSALPAGAHDYNYTTIGPDSGGPFQEVEFIQALEERLTFSSEALDSLLDNFSLTQINCIGAGKTYTEMHLYGRRLDPCGVAGTSAGSTHAQAKATLARLVFTQLTASGNGTASLAGYAILLSADGMAEASTVAYNVALPTGGIVDEAFKLHGVKLGGVTLDDDKITQLTLDTGLRVVPVFGTKSRPREVSFTKTVPTLTIASEDTSLVSSFPRSGTIATHANSLIELRKRDPTTGGEVATATTSHIALTVAGTVRPQNISGSGSQVATSGLVATLTGIAGTPPIAVSTGVALTL